MNVSTADSVPAGNPGAHAACESGESPRLHQGSISVADLEKLCCHLEKRVFLRTKRAIDVVMAACLLLLLVPVLLLIAVAILIDSGGPVLFWQARVGRDGKVFRMVKFRTMRRERRVRCGAPPRGVAERRRRHKTRHDPRVTRTGHWLRRTCLDELPQLWNVLTGDMSIVGPRPELPEIVARYEPWQHVRHRLRPGITGWWQVMRDSTGECLMHEATEFDLFYVAHASLSLDLRIMWRTLGVVLRGTGAF